MFQSSERWKVNKRNIQLTLHLYDNGDRVLTSTVVCQTSIITGITHLNCIDHQMPLAANSNATTGHYFPRPLVPRNLSSRFAVGSTLDCDSLTIISNNLLSVYKHWWWNWRVNFKMSCELWLTTTVARTCLQNVEVAFTVVFGKLPLPESKLSQSPYNVSHGSDFVNNLTALLSW